MKQYYIIISLLIVFLAPLCMKAETYENLPYGNFNSWVIREIKESGIIGGQTKTVYAIGPNKVIKGDIAYKPQGGSPWATSNIMAKVVGITKCSNAVFREKRNENDYCVKMTTILEEVTALGLINIKVLVSGSFFLGEMMEPITNTKSPYSKMEMGIPFTKRPTHLVYDYNVTVPKDNRMMYCSGFSPRKQLEEPDNAEVYILLQRRWEDEDGNLHALRVGTGRQRYSKSSAGWVNNNKLPVWYGDITKRPDYKPYMGLLSGEKAYYARNSKGKMVPVQEEGWADANATPTHMLVMGSSGCGTAYVGTVGMTLLVDNIRLQY